MNTIELARCFQRQFELCRVKSGETIVLLTDASSNRTVVDNAVAAAAAAGANAYERRVQQGRVSGQVDANPFDIPGISEALEKADLAICLFSAFFSRWHKPFRARGGRILNVLDVPEQLIRLQSSDALKTVVLATSDRVRKTKTIRVTNEAGTDFRYQVDHDAPLFTHYGFADEPGHMDHWGQGMIAMTPVEGSANGTVVI